MLHIDFLIHFSILSLLRGFCIKGIMKAIIFAAGCSSRLEELTSNLPKCCLKLREEQTILQRALSILKENNIQHVIIVTGFASEHIDNEVESWQEQFETITTVYNPHYEDRNNIYTAFLIRDLIDSDTLIINSDLVFDPKILEIAVEAIQSGKQSFLVVDDKKELVDEDMKILVNQLGKIIRIHKSLDNAKARGEYIGILRLTENDLAIFKQSLEQMIERKDFGKYYEDAIDERLSDMNLSYLSTNGLEWTEVDNKIDYTKAIEQVGQSS